MAISAFDIFKIGFGPSSSHTFGPMVACLRFINELQAADQFDKTERVTVTLYGSLGSTGKGHFTDVAVVLGLEGNNPPTTASDTVLPKTDRVRKEKNIQFGGKKKIPFDWDTDIIWKGEQTLPKHPNGIEFAALGKDGKALFKGLYFSIGGGFVVGEKEPIQRKEAIGEAKVPFPFTTGAQLLELCKKGNKSVADVMLENEKTWRKEAEVRAGLLNIAKVMENCIKVGLQGEGEIPGGLKVQRVAKKIHAKLAELAGQKTTDLITLSGHASAYAIAVNEVNASLGQIVTAPTMGAAGTIPAVLQCFKQFHPKAGDDTVVQFLLAAAAIGIMVKINSTLSGADGGCQAEVGTACAQAAAGLVQAVGGTPEQVLNAAAMALEHNLGLTCDPVAGLVQVPCIERNALAANKAINSATLVLLEGKARVKPTFDEVVKAHWEIAQGMDLKFKETSKGGLAVSWTNC